MIKDKKPMISFFLKSIPCACAIYLFTTVSANATPQKTKHIKKASTPKIQFSFIPEKRKTSAHKKNKHIKTKSKKTLNLSIKIENKSAINFKKIKRKNRIKRIKERYLTIYSRKKGKEKLKAVYLHGAYAIKYVQKW